MSENFYETLGVSKSASQAEIKSAYKKLAIKYHPDRNQDDKANCEKKMKKINEAYGVIGDEKKRAEYDRFGSSGGNGGFGGGNGGFSGDFSGFGGFEDIFNNMSDMFGGGSKRRASPQKKGSDLRYTLQLTLEEVYKGVSKNINFNALGKCTDCNGKGGEGVSTCSECDGAGAVRYQQGFFIVENTCPKCNGDGQEIRNKCKTCKGAGRYQKKFDIKVDVPKGIGDGDNIRMSGHGEAGIKGGASGDLYVSISIIKHEFFTRNGSDINCDVQIDFLQAILGDEITIPLINGEQYKVKIPEGSQYDAKIRIPEKGLPKYNSSRMGDMFINLKIETPVNLGKKELEALKELKTSMDQKSTPMKNKFIDKIKKFFG